MTVSLSVSDKLLNVCFGMEMPWERLLAIRCKASEVIASEANFFEVPQTCCVTAFAFKGNVSKAV